MAEQPANVWGLDGWTIDDSHSAPSWDSAHEAALIEAIRGVIQLHFDDAVDDAEHIAIDIVLGPLRQQPDRARAALAELVPAAEQARAALRNAADCVGNQCRPCHDGARVALRRLHVALRAAEQALGDGA